MVEEFKNGISEFMDVFEVVGRQHLSLKLAEDNLDLIKPGGMNGEPMNLDLEGKLKRGDPGSQLLAGMSGAVIEDEMKALDILTPQASEDRSQETLEINEAFPREAPRQGFTGSHLKGGEELDGSLAFISIADLEATPRPGRAHAALKLPGLNRWFFIRTDDDMTRPSQVVGLGVKIQDRDGLLQESGIGGFLPGVEPPGFDLVGLEPAPQGRDRQPGNDFFNDRGFDQIRNRPPREGLALLPRQRAGQGDHVRSLNGGKKNVSGRDGEPRPTAGLPGWSGCAISARWTRRIRHSGQSFGCPSPDAHRPGPGSWRGPLPHAGLYGVG